MPKSAISLKMPWFLARSSLNLLCALKGRVLTFIPYSVIPRYTASTAKRLLISLSLCKTLLNVPRSREMSPDQGKLKLA